MRQGFVATGEPRQAVGASSSACWRLAAGLLGLRPAAGELVDADPQAHEHVGELGAPAVGGGEQFHPGPECPVGPAGGAGRDRAQRQGVVRAQSGELGGCLRLPVGLPRAGDACQQADGLLGGQRVHVHVYRPVGSGDGAAAGHDGRAARLVRDRGEDLGGIGRVVEDHEQPPPPQPRPVGPHRRLHQPHLTARFFRSKPASPSFARGPGGGAGRGVGQVSGCAAGCGVWSWSCAGGRSLARAWRRAGALAWGRVGVRSRCLRGRNARRGGAWPGAVMGRGGGARSWTALLDRAAGPR